MDLKLSVNSCFGLRAQIQSSVAFSISVFLTKHACLHDPAINIDPAVNINFLAIMLRI